MIQKQYIYECFAWYIFYLTSTTSLMKSTSASTVDNTVWSNNGTVSEKKCWITAMMSKFCIFNPHTSITFWTLQGIGSILLPKRCSTFFTREENERRLYICLAGCLFYSRNFSFYPTRVALFPFLSLFAICFWA